MALDETRERSGRAFRVFARLRDGVTLDQARQEIAPFAAAQLRTVPPRFRKEIRWAVQSVRDRQVGSSRIASYALMGSAIAVLLIACANIMNLLLARAVAREREFAMRAALGASPARLVRLVLTESLLLGVAGGLSGCFVAWALLRVVVNLGAGTLPRIENATLDGRVLTAAAVLSIGTSVMFGLVPAWRQSRTALAGWRATPRSRGGLRSLMVAVQVALSVVLLASAGLLLRTLWLLENTQTGMIPEHVITARFVLGKERYGASAQTQVDFFNELEHRLTRGPGIQAVSVSDSIPPTGGTRGRPYSTIEIEGELPAPEGSGGMVAWRYVTPGYFTAIGVRTLAGRVFTAEDQEPGAAAIILNETLARRMFPRGDAVGKRLLKMRDGRWHTVVGVVADVRNRGLERGADPEYYLVRKKAPDENFANAEPPLGWRASVAVVRTPVAPALAAAILRDTIRELDKTLPVEVETMPERLHEVTMRPRFQAWLLVAFGVTGLVLAVIGLYGSLAYIVGQREREFGVRLALGAEPGHLLRLVLAQTARWLVAGVAAGLVMAFGAARVARTLLFGVAPGDPWALALAVAVLVCAALMAAAGPAWQAARVDPSRTLKQE
jgi:predicted permease